MRYAPSCLLFVRRGAGALRFGLVRRREGVCDTPLHVYRLFVVGLGRCFPCLFAAVRAYAIRPYMFTVCSSWRWGVAFRACLLTSGRMRYAPTVFGRITCWVGARRQKDRHPYAREDGGLTWEGHRPGRFIPWARWVWWVPWARWALWDRFLLLSS